MVPTQSTSLIGSRLIDFSLYWNWCRWFSVLLLCKSNSYVLEMMNDEVLGMECTSLFLLFFSWKWKFEKVRSCSFFRYMPPHKQYYVHAQHVLTFTYLDFSDGNVSCNLTETVNIFKYFTICIFFFIHTKKINRMMGFFPIFIKVFFFVIADVLQNCVEMWILKMQIFFFNPRPFFIISI